MAAYTTPAWVNNNSNPPISAASLKEMGEAIELSEHPYGVCNTTAGTQQKSVQIQQFTGTLSLFTGLTVRIKFTNGNTATAPSLNVNSTGSIPIKAYGTVAPEAYNTWLAGQVLDFTYDGTNWMFTSVNAYEKSQNLSDTARNIFNMSYGASPKTPDEAFRMIGNNFSYTLKAINGTYNGNGNYGSNKKNSLTLVLGSGRAITPMMLAVYKERMNPYQAGGWDGSFIWFPGITSATTGLNAAISIAQSTNTISWYSTTSAVAQLNENGVRYNYVAFGV